MIAIAFFLGLSVKIGFANPQPGDFFRDYIWTMPKIDGVEPYLRVGGNFDYRKQVPKFAEGDYRDGEIRFPFEIDFNHANKAEIIIDKMLCHDRTTGLTLKINHKHSFLIPKADSISEPQSEYMHHFSPVIEVPLDALNQDQNNYFSFTVDQEHPWNWPQNLIYGVVLRIYYDSVEYQPLGEMKKIPDSKIREKQELRIQSEKIDQIAKVDFIGNYEGVNLEGDGVYHQWHYFYFNGDLHGLIGTAKEKPFSVEWNTEWIPDQKEPIEIAALITNKDGLKYFTKPISGLKLERDHQVELCKPYEQPKFWVTRNGEFSCPFDIQGDLEKAAEIQFVWKSWSPGYMNGLYVNDFILFKKEGQNYSYHEHFVTTDQIKYFHHGRNLIKTGGTPRYHGTMVHGAEIQWPGIMVLVKYDPNKEKDPYHRYPKQPSGQDFSASYQSAWNDNGLYFAIEIKDDDITEKDELNLFFRKDLIQIKTKEYTDSNNYKIKISQGIDTVEIFQESAHNKINMDHKILMEKSKTDAGWNCEVLIPWDFLDLQKKTLKMKEFQMGFEISVIDHDSENIDDPDFLTWANHRTVPGHWIEHNNWGLADFVYSYDQIHKRLATVDWADIPSLKDLKIIKIKKVSQDFKIDGRLNESFLSNLKKELIMYWLP